VDEQGGVSVPEEHATRILYMPESPDNSNKVRTVSGAPHVYLPASIPPLNCQQEETLISSIMRELNDTFDANVTGKPDLSRSSGDAHSMTEKTTDRIFVIGASHVKRMVGGLESLNMDIVDLSRPGWKADPEHIADIAENQKKYDITDTDTLLIDPLSNKAVCGTDANGMPVNQTKIGKSWHIVVCTKTEGKEFTGTNPRYCFTRKKSSHHCTVSASPLRY
jgi:hypothetical protein